MRDMDGKWRTAFEAETSLTERGLGKTPDPVRALLYNEICERNCRERHPVGAGDMLADPTVAPASIIGRLF
jgi:hypothetical protein